jgi:hypothetical protein
MHLFVATWALINITKSMVIAAGSSTQRPIHHKIWDWSSSAFRTVTCPALTPKLSGAPQQTDWHFIHGASAQTIVRELGTPVSLCHERRHTKLGIT